MSHFNNSSRHNLDFSVPFSFQFRIFKNSGYNSCTENWRIGVDWTNQSPQLTSDNFSFFLIISEESKGTNKLTIETKILSKGLANCNIVTISSKDSNWCRISFTVSRCKTLISKIKESKVFFIFT